MIQVLYSTLTDKLTDESFERLYALLTPQMQKQALQYRYWKDAQRSVLGKALLIEGLKYFDLDHTKLLDLKFTQFQKPYFTNGIYFNISHSGDCVVCAIGCIEIGIDIEQVKEIPLTDFEDLFSVEELQQIHKIPNDFTAFYTLWTQKEAFVKAIGMGLNIPLNKIIVTNNTICYEGSCWYLKDLAIASGHICHIISEDPNVAIACKQIYFD